MPPAQVRKLRAMADSLRQGKAAGGRDAPSSSRTESISALFSGPSGTGKTIAAEAIANELGLDLYRVDLGHLVSKYIGETEKNLDRIFDAAGNARAILFLDFGSACTFPGRANCSSECRRPPCRLTVKGQGGHSNAQPAASPAR